MIPTVKRVAGRRAAIMLSLVSALTLHPVPARAQLGGLGGRVRGAVEQKVENRVEEELPYTRLPAPEFNERLLQITDSRLEGLLRGFAAEVDYAEEAGAEYEAQRRAHDAAMAEYERAMEAYASQRESYDACSARFDQQESEARAANDAAVQKALDEMGDEEFAAYVQALAMRGEQLAREMQSSNGPPSDELMRRQQEYIAAVTAMQVEQSRRVQLGAEPHQPEMPRPLRPSA